MFRAFLIITIVLIHAVAAFGAEIKVVTESWPPYTFCEDGKVKGVVTEVVDETLKRSGLDYSIEIYPWARAYDMAKSNENVLIYTIFRLPNREKLFKWIQIEGLYVDMFLFRPKHRTDIAITTIEEAKDYRVGVTRETSTHHFLLDKGFVEGANLFPVNSEEQNTLKSSPKSMRIDLTTGDRLSLVHGLKEANLLADYWVAQVPLFQKDFYMAFGADTSDEIVETVRKAFREMKEEGRLDAILDKYRQMRE